MDARRLLFGFAVCLSQLSLAGGEETQSAEADHECRVTEAVARDRAKLLHQVYSSSLEAMHERYFHGERAIVPARTLEDVFAEVARATKVKARWISVNTKPMSITHEPKSEFEKQAAAEIGKGVAHVERVENGEYFRAAPIALGGGCIQCHTGFFSGEPKSPRYAALVIRIPLDAE